MGRLFVERAIAERARRVILWDVDEAAFAATVAELETGDHETRLTAYGIDVTDRPTVEATATEILGDAGPVDVLVNNAGIVRGNRYFWESDPARDTEATIAVNTLAPMHIARAFLPAMIEHSSEARLVNIARPPGSRPTPDGDPCGVEVGRHRLVRLGAPGAQAGRLRPRQGDDGVPLLRQHRHVRRREVGAAAADPRAGRVVDESWKGMLDGEAFVVLPRTVMLNEALKGLLPVSVRDFIADRVIGVYHTMDDFTGRR